MLEKQAEKFLVGVPEEDAKKMKKIVNGFTRLVYPILKFLAMMYIFDRVYDRIGFDKTIITLLIIIIVLMMNKNRKDFFK